MIIQNEELKALLLEKETLVNEGKKLTEKIEKVEKERAKVGLQIQKVKDKIIPLVIGLKLPLGEYEGLKSVEIKGGEIVVEVTNYMDEFIESWKTRDAQPEPETTN